MYCPAYSVTTRQSNRHSHATVHNCPSCYCYNPFSKQISPQHRISHVRSQTQLPNLYNSQQIGSPRGDIKKQGRSIFKSLIFGTANNATQPQKISPSRASITFSYSSPQRKKHSSLNSKLSTKTFKAKHFPNLKDRQAQPLKKLVKDEKRSSCYYEIYTNTEAPKQPKILKMNKAKSKQKMEITLSPKNSSKNSRVQLSQKEPSLTNNPYNQSQFEPTLSNAPYNQYGIDINKPTPINALWEREFEDEKKGQNSLSKGISQSQFIVYSKEHSQVPSIERIRFKGSPTSSNMHISISQHSNLAQSKVVQLKSNKNSAVSNEISSEKQHAVTQLPLTSNKNAPTDSQARIQIFKDRSINESQEVDVKELEKDWQIARSLTEQLQLNYDYFQPNLNSDKSLSLNITL